MRRRTATGAALVLLLVLAATPQVAGSLTPASFSPQPESGFRTLDVPAAAFSAAGSESFEPVAHGTVVLPGLTPAPTPVATRKAKPRVTPDPTPPPTPPPTPRPTPRPTAQASPSNVLRGYATWYDNGTTAMRLPRGTRVKICGRSACVTRTINDYGPAASTGRIADLMPADFRMVCGCSTSAGVTKVTVYVL